MGKAGGKREGAGRPPGPSKQTLSKLEARELLRQAVMKHMDTMVEAQVANAKGLKYLITRDKRNGKFIRVTEAMAKVKEDETSEHEIIEVWEKDPSVQAFTDLMNRTLDKPPEAEPDQPWKGELSITWKD